MPSCAFVMGKMGRLEPSDPSSAIHVPKPAYVISRYSNHERFRKVPGTFFCHNSYQLSTTRWRGTMDGLNPADFAVPQPYLNPVRMERGVREQVLDDAASQFSCALVLFEDN